MSQEESLLKAFQRRMIGHAMLILLIGMFAGIGLLVSLIGGVEVLPGSLLPLHLPGNPDAWVRIHLGQMLNAFLIVLIALILPLLGFSAGGGRRISWLIVATGWANTIFYWAALFAPNRAFTFGDNRLGVSNTASVMGLIPALLFAIISIIVVAAVAIRAFRRDA